MAPDGPRLLAVTESLSLTGTRRHSPLLAGSRDGGREALLSHHPALSARVLGSLILIAVPRAREVTLVVACVHKLGVRPHKRSPAGPSATMQEVRLPGLVMHQSGPALCSTPAKARHSLSERQGVRLQATTANTCRQDRARAGADLAPP